MRTKPLTLSEYVQAKKSLHEQGYSLLAVAQRMGLDQNALTSILLGRITRTRSGHNFRPIVEFNRAYLELVKFLP